MSSSRMVSAFSTFSSDSSVAINMIHSYMDFTETFEHVVLILKFNVKKLLL